MEKMEKTCIWEYFNREVEVTLWKEVTSGVPQGQTWELVLLSIFEKTLAQEVGHILMWLVADRFLKK